MEEKLHQVNCGSGESVVIMDESESESESESEGNSFRKMKNKKHRK